MSDDFVLRVSVVNKEVLKQYEREASEQPLPDTPAAVPHAPPYVPATAADEPQEK